MSVLSDFGGKPMDAIEKCITACDCAGFGEPKLIEWAREARAELDRLRRRSELLEKSLRDMTYDDIIHVLIFHEYPKGNIGKLIDQIQEDIWSAEPAITQGTIDELRKEATALDHLCRRAELDRLRKLANLVQKDGEDGELVTALAQLIITVEVFRVADIKGSETLDGRFREIANAKQALALAREAREEK